MKFITKHIYLITLGLLYSYCYPQKSVPFSVRFQSNVKGDMTVLANNIANRIDANNSNTAYINRVNQPSNNEDYQMGYIDIDDDPTTFSSSSAVLKMENQSGKKIIYAGLYWAATYKYNKGIKSEKGKYVTVDATRDSISNIKIKLPNQENYINIKGQVIFDGINQKRHKQNAPYVVYADITNEISKLKNPFGNYTVANVRSTIGTLQDGVASGWTIFFVYEDDQMSEKFIVSQDGFIELSNKANKNTFSGFKIESKGNINAKIAVAALEGDRDKTEDGLYFKTNNKYIPFENVLRQKDNFFNSTITVGNDYLQNRNPNSNNTFGYDTFLASIPNKENQIISPNSKDIKIKFKSKKDKVYLFFTAFSVETKQANEKSDTNQVLDSHSKATNSQTTNVVDTSLNEQLEGFVSMNMNIQSSVKDTISTTSTSDNNIITESQSSNAIQNSAVETKTDVAKETNVATTTMSITTENNQIILQNQNYNTSSALTEDYTNYDIDGIEKGYYIIVNVFAKEKNRANFVKYLKAIGLNANSFYNPQKKYYYVYIESSTNKSEIEALRNSKINNKYQDDMWILAVNKPLSSESYTVNSKTQKAIVSNTIKVKTGFNKVNILTQAHKTCVLTSLLSSFYINKEQA